MGREKEREPFSELYLLRLSSYLGLSASQEEGVTSLRALPTVSWNKILEYHIMKDL